MKYTDEQLKDALTKAFNGKILKYPSGSSPSGWIFIWTDNTSRNVTNYEWEGVVREVELRLSDVKLNNYIHLLQDSFPFSVHSPTPAILADWKQRTTALIDSKAITLSLLDKLDIKRRKYWVNGVRIAVRYNNCKNKRFKKWVKEERRLTNKIDTLLIKLNGSSLYKRN